MTTKVTLITPPDIFQNNENSIMLLDVTEKEQDDITHWLTTNEIPTLNIYFFQGEPNIGWLLHSLACTSHKYMNLDNLSPVSIHYAGYILSKQDVFYYTDDTNTAELYSYINSNRVTNITDFLERIFSGKK